MQRSLTEINPLAVPDSTETSPGKPGNEAWFVGSNVFRKEAFGKHHPLSIPRQSGVLELSSLLGWLEHGDMVDCHAPGDEQLCRFHDPLYLEILKQADRTGTISKPDREKTRIGTMENPLFSGLFERAATAVGGSIMAAELALEGGTAFHPAGGTHHGRPDRASGFCYFNDPVFAIMTLLDGGLERVLYVDLDAHHGDGVQDAFECEERVFTVSIHEKNRWPHTGPLEDRGAGQARNLPVPRGFNDEELAYLLDEAVLPLGERFNPQGLVITCGADGLAGDPLSKLELSNRGLWNAVQRLVETSEHNVVLGGGGYNPWTVVRCWTGLWGSLSGRKIPDTLSAEAQALLRSFSCDLVDEEDVPAEWLTTLKDRPDKGEVSDEVRALPARVLS